MALNEDALNNFKALESYCLMFDIATSLALNSANSNFIHGSFERSFPKHVLSNALHVFPLQKKKNRCRMNIWEIEFRFFFIFWNKINYLIT